jgi:hypothetical protein
MDGSNSRISAPGSRISQSADAYREEAARCTKLAITCRDAEGAARWRQLAKEYKFTARYLGFRWATGRVGKDTGEPRKRRGDADMWHRKGASTQF